MRILVLSITLLLFFPAQAWSKEDVKAQAPAPEKDSAKAAEKSAKEPPKASAKPAAEPKRKAPATGFVPPPPPSIPSLINMQDIPGLLVAPEYMTLDQLKQKQKEIQAQLDAQEDTVKRDDQKAGRSKEQAESFKELFAEGVVSRRELENSEQAAKDSVSDGASNRMRLTDLKTLIGQINTALEKRSKSPLKSSTRSASKSKSRLTKQASKKSSPT